MTRPAPFTTAPRTPAPYTRLFAASAAPGDTAPAKGESVTSFPPIVTRTEDIPETVGVYETSYRFCVEFQTSVGDWTTSTAPHAPNVLPGFVTDTYTEGVIVVCSDVRALPYRSAATT